MSDRTMRICKKCQHPEYRHPVVQIVNDECGQIPILICGEFENAGTLNEIWHSPIKVPEVQS